MTLKVGGTTATQDQIDTMRTDLQAPKTYTGTASPEGSQEAVVGDFYLETDANVLWVKETGSGNTGWLIASGSDSLEISNGPSTTSPYVYYGGTRTSGAWQVNRFHTTTFAKGVANISNNSGTTNIATAWTNRTSLVYG